MELNSELKAYIEKEILPRYQNFDMAHNSTHVTNVIGDGLKIAEDFPVNINMVYAIAVYHDCALDEGRELHHVNSARVLREDINLRNWFSNEEILTMAEAVEDHRASNKTEPRSIYGKIVADADREFSVERLILRTVSFGKKNYPELSKQEHFDRAFDHVLNKYGPNGYMKFYLKSKSGEEKIQELYRLLENREEFNKECEKYL